MTWYAVYEQVSGRLVSVGTVVASPLPKGLTTAQFPQLPHDSQMWDEPARTFVPRPPKQVIDPEGDPELTAIRAELDRLNPSQRQAVRRLLDNA